MEAFRLRIDASGIENAAAEKFWMHIDKKSCKKIRDLENNLIELLKLPNRNLNLDIDGFTVLSDHTIDVLHPNDKIYLRSYEEGFPYPKKLSKHRKRSHVDETEKDNETKKHKKDKDTEECEEELNDHQEKKKKKSKKKKKKRESMLEALIKGKSGKKSKIDDIIMNSTSDDETNDAVCMDAGRRNKRTPVKIAKEKKKANKKESQSQETKKDKSKADKRSRKKVVDDIMNAVEEKQIDETEATNSKQVLAAGKSTSKNNKKSGNKKNKKASITVIKKKIPLVTRNDSKKGVNNEEQSNDVVDDNTSTVIVDESKEIEGEEIDKSDENVHPVKTAPKKKVRPLFKYGKRRKRRKRTTKAKPAHTILNGKTNDTVISENHTSSPIIIQSYTSTSDAKLHYNESTVVLNSSTEINEVIIETTEVTTDINKNCDQNGFDSEATEDNVETHCGLITADNQPISNGDTHANNELVSNEKNYSVLPKLKYPPRVGDKIAFKVLELTENYNPIVSNFKVGVVISDTDGTLIIKLNEPQLKYRDGRFEMMIGNEEDCEKEVYETEIEVAWKSMLETKLL